MPAPLRVPWDKIRQDYLGDVPMDVIAGKYGVKPSAIYKRAWRESWKEPRHLVERLAEPQVKRFMKGYIANAMDEAQPILKDAIKEWLEESHKVAGAIREKVSQALDEAAKPDELAKLASTLSTTDQVGRRSLGLDQVQPTTTVNAPVLLILGSYGSAENAIGTLMDYGQEQSAQVIDVQSAPAETI